jgi:hypothetical protein
MGLSGEAQFGTIFASKLAEEGIAAVWLRIRL